MHIRLTKKFGWERHWPNQLFVAGVLPHILHDLTGHLAARAIEQVEERAFIPNAILQPYGIYAAIGRHGARDETYLCLVKVSGIQG